MTDLPRAAWLGAGLAFVAVAMCALALALAWEGWRAYRLRRRLDRELRSLAVADLSPDAQQIFRDEAADDWLSRAAARMPRALDVSHVLRQGGLGWSAQTFLLATLAAALGPGLFVLLITKRPLIAALVAFVASLLPYAYVSRRRTRRVRAFEEQLPDAVDLLGRAIRAGHPLSSGMKMVADETDEPIAGEFRQVFEETRFGLPFDDALLALADRLPLLDVRIFVTAVLIQREVGGNLAEMLDKIAYTVRERFKLRRQIRVITAESRLSAYILALLPIATGIIIYFIHPTYVMTLFTDQMGKMLLMGALFLQVVGFFWMKRITTIEI